MDIVCICIVIITVFLSRFPDDKIFHIFFVNVMLRRAFIFNLFIEQNTPTPPIYFYDGFFTFYL